MSYSRVKHTRYLGITLDNKLSWKDHVKKVKKGNINFFKTTQIIDRNLLGKLTNTLNTTCNTYLKPILKHGSEVQL